jgi:ABC-type protease/lipase transport system fused ATPase/permease subunit
MRSTHETLRQAGWAVAGAGVASGLCLGAGLALVVIAVRGIEAIAASGATSALLPLAAALVAVVVALVIADLCVDRLLLRAGLWVDHVLEPRILRAGLADVDPAGSLLDTNRMLGQVRDFLLSADLRTLLSLPWLLAAAATLAVFDPRTDMVVVAMAGAVIAIAGCAALALGPTLRAQSNANLQVRRGVVTAAQTGDALVGLGLAERTSSLGQSVNRTWIAAAFRHGRRLTTALAIGRLVLATAEIALVCLAVLAVLTGAISAVAGVLAAVLALRLLRPLQDLPGLTLRCGSAWLAWRHLGRISLSDAARRLFDDSGIGAAAGPRRLEMRDVDFVSTSTGQTLLSRVSIAIEPGQALAIHGAPGAGKSIVASLFAGGLVPTGGLVLLGGSPVRPQQCRTSTPQVGWVMQEPVLLDGTVTENILRFGSAGTHAGPHQATAEDIARMAARHAGVEGVLATLADGFATRVGPGGKLLSIRQRRAVALARALAGNPSYIVLDEPETLLDEAAIATLAETLAGRMADRVGVCLVTRHPVLAALSTRDLLIVDGALVPIAKPADDWWPQPANDRGDSARPSRSYPDDLYSDQPDTDQPLALVG